MAYGKSYHGDPYWITAHYQSQCSCGKVISKGDDAYYYPERDPQAEGQVADDPRDGDGGAGGAGQGKGPGQPSGAEIGMTAGVYPCWRWGRHEGQHQCHPS